MSNINQVIPKQDFHLAQVSNEIIQSFFLDYGLEDSLYNLWQMFKLAFSGNSRGLTRREKDDIAHFYKRFEELLIALDNHNNLMKKP